MEDYRLSDLIHPNDLLNNIIKITSIQERECEKEREVEIQVYSKEVKDGQVWKDGSEEGKEVMNINGQVYQHVSEEVKEEGKEVINEIEDSNEAAEVQNTAVKDISKSDIIIAEETEVTSTTEIIEENTCNKELDQLIESTKVAELSECIVESTTETNNQNTESILETELPIENTDQSTELFNAEVEMESDQKLDTFDAEIVENEFEIIESKDMDIEVMPKKIRDIDIFMKVYREDGLKIIDTDGEEVSANIYAQDSNLLIQYFHISLSSIYFSSDSMYCEDSVMVQLSDKIDHSISLLEFTICGEKVEFKDLLDSHNDSTNILNPGWKYRRWLMKEQSNGTFKIATNTSNPHNVFRNFETEDDCITEIRSAFRRKSSGSTILLQTLFEGKIFSQLFLPNNNFITPITNILSNRLRRTFMHTKKYPLIHFLKEYFINGKVLFYLTEATCPTTQEWNSFKDLATSSSTILDQEIFKNSRIIETKALIIPEALPIETIVETVSTEAISPESIEVIAVAEVSSPLINTVKVSIDEIAKKDLELENLRDAHAKLLEQITEIRLEKNQILANQKATADKELKRQLTETAELYFDEDKKAKSLTNDLKDLNVKTSKLEVENNTLKISLAESQSVASQNKAEFNSKFDLLQAELKTLRNTALLHVDCGNVVESFKTEIKELNNKIVSLTSELSSRTKDVLLLTTSLKELNQSVIEQDELLDSREKGIGEETNLLNSRISKLTEENKNLKDSLSEANKLNKQTVSETLKENKQLTKEISSLKKDISSIQEKYDSIIESNTSLEEQIKTLKSQNFKILSEKETHEKSSTLTLEACDKAIVKSQTRVQKLKSLKEKNDIEVEELVAHDKTISAELETKEMEAVSQKVIEKSVNKRKAEIEVVPALLPKKVAKTSINKSDVENLPPSIKNIEKFNSFSTAISKNKEKEVSIASELEELEERMNDFGSKKPIVVAADPAAKRKLFTGKSSSAIFSGLIASLGNGGLKMPKLKS